MTTQETKKKLNQFIRELKCHLTDWHESIPVHIVRKWIKQVEIKIIHQIKEEDEPNTSSTTSC